VTNKSHLFADILKTPSYLQQFDVMRIRKAAEGNTDEDFKEYFSCDKKSALRILGFWEVAQVELWNAEILKRFFHVWIYEDREMVAARIQAAQKAGRLPEHFTPELGLKWLESENVLMGGIPDWVKANARRRNPQPLTTTETAPIETGVQSGTVKERQDRRLKRLRELGGKVVKKGGYLRVDGLTKLVESEKVAGSYAKSDKTVRADVKAAFIREQDTQRNGLFTGLGSR